MRFCLPAVGANSRQIKYDDGVSESLHLQKERFKLDPVHALDADGCPLPVKQILEVVAPPPPTKPKPVPKEAVCEMPPDATLPRPGEVRAPATVTPKFNTPTQCADRITRREHSQ